MRPLTGSLWEASIAESYGTVRCFVINVRFWPRAAALESAVQGIGITPSAESSQSGTEKDHWNKAALENNIL